MSFDVRFRKVAFFWKSSMDVLIYLQQRINWGSSTALIGSSVVVIASLLFGSSLYSALSIIRPQHLTSFVYKTSLFAERQWSYLPHIWKTFSKCSRGYASVLVFTVNASIHAFMACFMPSNKGGIVEWKYLLAVSSPYSTLVDKNVYCGAVIPNDLYESGSRGHCQKPEQSWERQSVGFL